MSNVALTIGGRSYTVACGPGEERHIAGLGEMIDGKLRDMANLAGQSEARTLLFAALLLADELHELRTASNRSQDTEAAEALETLAGRLETLAERLETGDANA